MKFRTDFVTNSSSSSYSVSLIMSSQKQQSIILSFRPKGGELFDYDSSLRSTPEFILQQFRHCKTKAEMKSYARKSIDITNMFKEFCEELGLEDTDALLKEFSEGYFGEDNYKDYWIPSYQKYKYSREVLQTIESFEKRIDSLDNLAELDEISVYEYYTGWGEFARDGVDAFLRDILPGNLYRQIGYKDNNAEALAEVRKCLEDMLDDAAVESLINQITDDTVTAFNAEIMTTINMKTGSITKEYMFEEL